MTTPSSSADAAATSEPSRWTVVLCALIGLGVGLTVFALRTPTYQAEAVVDVNNPAGAMADEVSVVTSPALIDVAEALVGFPPTISVSAAEVTRLLTITASSDSPEDAAAAANAVASTYVQAQPGAAATITQSAEIPSSPRGFRALANRPTETPWTMRGKDDPVGTFQRIQQHRIQFSEMKLGSLTTLSSRLEAAGEFGRPDTAMVP